MDQKSKIPGKNEFPEIKPYLETYEFPADILTEEMLETTLNVRRIDAIRNALLNLGVTINNKCIITSTFLAYNLQQYQNISPIFPSFNESTFMPKFDPYQCNFDFHGFTDHLSTHLIPFSFKFDFAIFQEGSF